MSTILNLTHFSFIMCMSTFRQIGLWQGMSLIVTLDYQKEGNFGEGVLKLTKKSKEFILWTIFISKYKLH